jgi:hypothetical protein
MTQHRRRWTYEEVAKLVSLAQMPDSPNRFRDRPAPSFRPPEGPRPGYLFANGSAPRQTNRGGASGLA